MAKEITARDLARLLGLTPQRICQLANEGVIVKLRHGVYDKDESVHGYLVNFRAARLEEIAEYRRQRTRLIGLRADKLQMENDEMRRELIAKGIL